MSLTTASAPKTEAEQEARPLLVSQSLDIPSSISNDTIVRHDCLLHIRGDLLGSLTIERGAKVIVEGTIEGKIINRGGSLVVNNRGIAACARLDGPPDAEACGVLRINLSAVAANWDLLTQRSQAECGAVVKGNAYGCGIEPVVGTLLRVGCKTFFVSNIPEARRVRSVSPDAAIYVFDGFYSGIAPVFAEVDARPVIYSAAELAEWEIFVAGQQWPGGYALHVDTGAARRGISLQDAAALAPRIRSSNHGLKLLLSRLDSPGTSSEAQRDRQITGLRELRRLLDGVPASLATSSGIFSSPKAHLDLVRAGSAVYGINPTPGSTNPMRPVLELRAHILEVKTLAKGETLAGQFGFTAKRPTQLALVSAGRADGFPLPISAKDQKLQVIVGNRRCPVIGRPSLDLVAIDVTDLPERSTARRGGMATLIGEGISVDDLAAATQQTGREVIACLGGRFHRVYHAN